MTDKIMKVVGYITITGTFILIGVISSYLFYTPKYFETKQPFKLSKTEYHIGETLTYTSEYCKYADYIPLRIERSLVDGYVYPLPVSSASAVSLPSFPVGCRTLNIEVPLIVPANTPTGKQYHVEIVIDYKINILRNETRTFKTEEFVLLPEKK